VPLICPTCQNVFTEEHPARRSRLLCMGLFSIFRLGASSGREARLAEPSLARTARLRPMASARQPSLASRAKAGGPGRTRTCNQTVMSGRRSIGSVDFAEFSICFDRVRCVLFASFLVRNWCGSADTVTNRIPPFGGSIPAAPASHSLNRRECSNIR
jgi:hypothetical protein